MLPDYNHSNSYSLKLYLSQLRNYVTIIIITKVVITFRCHDIITFVVAKHCDLYRVNMYSTDT